MPTDDLLYSRVLALVREQPWAILPYKLEEIRDLLRYRAAGGRLSLEEISERIGEPRRPDDVLATIEAAAGSSRATVGAVAVIPVFGTIVQRASLMTEMSGGTSTERVSALLRQAVDDPGVGSVVLLLDSPGGGVFGVPELADQIHEARGVKRIVAVADAMAASAAYWLAAACTEIVVTPSGQVGSIGVFAAHQDVSRLYEAEGVTVTLISAGRFKTEGNPFEPLSEEARAAIQATVSDYYTMFVKAVARGRGVSVADVRGGFGEGRMVGAQEAKRLGMVDRVDTLDATIARLSGRGSRPAVQRAESAGPEVFATGGLLSEADLDAAVSEAVNKALGRQPRGGLSDDSRRRLFDIYRR